MDRSQNHFGTYWMEAFDLFNIPINPFYNNVDGLSTNTEKLKRELKTNFPDIFSGLGFYSKVKAKFELKYATPIFRPKMQVPFAALAIIDKELNSRKNWG